MSNRGSQWWPPEASDTHQQPAQRRPNPLFGPGGKGLDPNVAVTLAQTTRLAQGNGLKKITARLPADLVELIRAEAHGLTGHKRRGFQNLLGILLRYGWEAYQRGELEVEMEPRGIDYQIVARK